MTSLSGAAAVTAPSAPLSPDRFQELLQEILEQNAVANAALSREIQSLTASHAQETNAQAKKIESLEEAIKVLMQSSPESHPSSDPAPPTGPVPPSRGPHDDVQAQSPESGPSSGPTPAPGPVPPPPRSPTDAPAQSPKSGPSSSPTPGTGPEPSTRRPRNLVVCIDGTSNQFSTKNTNVVELYSRLIRDETQLTFYNSGIGTYATPSWKSWHYYKQVFKNKVDLAFAFNFEPILLSAYRWLSENYQKGDVIYLFGFSRGAYQIRTLAAMIHNVGLLRKGNLDQIPFAYELYAELKKFENASMIDMCAHYKRTFSEPDVDVRFAGAWDTVSSVGLFRNKTLPGTTDGMLHVKFFRHALALDERRVKFLQENVRGGLGPEEKQTKGENGDPPHTKEVWFAGVHGDIGGGASTNMEMNHFGPALRWMMLEAAGAGLKLTDAPQQWEDEMTIHNSMTWPWLPFEVLPFVRLNYRTPNGLTWWPHLARPREVQPHQLIHSTALESTKKRRTRLPGGKQWTSIPDDDDIIEADPYTAANSLIAKINRHLSISSSEELRADLLELNFMLSREAGRRSLRDTPDTAGTLIALVGLFTETSDAEIAPAIRSVVDAALQSEFGSAEKQYTFSQLHPVFTYAEHHLDEDMSVRLQTRFAPAQVQAPHKHPGSVYCVSYLSDGERIVSGCDDGAVRIWDKTGQIVGAPMTGHTGPVSGLALLADGTKIASGSEDKTIRVWTAATGAMVALLQGHDHAVFSVAFSPDGTRIASGSYDWTIRVWDVATAKTVVGPIQGHSFSVWSVAFSPDGAHMASGAGGGAVCVWNAETGENLWRTKMSSGVLSVAFSPDGKRIVAGCDDGAVHVLDAETDKTVLGPLTGHTDWVRSVAFSPDGKQIASGSDDGTVRLWDTETGSELDVLRGHRNPVVSVAFSPDGKHVASASWDQTVRIWDATGEWKHW